MAVYSDRLLFIHIPKTGGRSCVSYLKQHVPGVVLPRPHDPNSPLPIGHIPLRDIERFSGRKPESFEKILAVIRDPYEQQYSQWAFWRDRYARNGRHPHDRVAALYPDLTHWLLDPMSDFHVWYEEEVGGVSKTVARRAGYSEFGSYYLYWIAVDGQVPDNVELVRFEHLSEHFPSAVRPFSKTRGEMPHDNRGIGRPHPVQAYYSDLARQIVETKFRWVFEAGLYEKWSAEP